MRLTPRAKILLGVLVVLIAGGVAWKWLIPHTPQVKCAGLLGRPLRVGVVTWPGYAGGIVANDGFKPNKDCLYYKEHNLCVEFQLMEDTGVRSNAFKKGGPEGVDIVWSTVDFWANELPGFMKDGLKAKAIMQVDWSRGGDAIVADNSIKKIEDLYGKKTALALFTPSHWLLEYNLENSRLTEAQQTAIVKDLVGKDASPDARAAFVAGKVDAAVVWEPDVAEALSKRPNSHKLISSEQARKLIADVMVAREDFIRDHGDAIQAFVDGWIVSGTIEANRHPEKAVRVLMENESLYKDMGEKATQANLSAVRWADLSDNTEMFNLDGKDNEPLFDQLFTKAGKAWVNRGYIPAAVQPAVARDTTFVVTAFKKYGPVERVPDKPEPARPEQAAGQAINSKPVAILFPSKRWDLSQENKKILDDDVALLPRTMSGAFIRVAGNTDSIGSHEYNLILSRQRAQSAVDYLVGQHKLPKAQFIVVGNGPDKPICPANDTADCKKQNRRTDFEIVPK